MSAHKIEAVLTAKDQGFTSTFDKALKTTETFGQKLKSGLGFGAFMAIGQKAVNGVFNLLNSSVDGAVKRFDTLNNFPKVMQSLGFSAKDAKASVDALGDGITYLPTTLDKVASQTQQVVAVTGDLGKATKLTLALNNAMASGGAPAEQQASAINQWTQAMAKGKPDLQDWRALVQTAPAQMNQLAEAMLGAGKSQTDLYQAMQDGSVSIDEVNDAMIKLSEQGGKGITSWAEQAKSAGGGIQMAMTNVKAGVQRNIANVMGIIDKSLEKLGGISGIIESIIPVFDKLGETITSVISGDTSLGDAVETLLTNISTKAKEFIPKGAEMVMNLIAGFMQQLPQMIVAGLNAVTRIIEGLDSGEGKLAGKAVKLAGKIALAFIKALPAMLKAGVQLIGALIKGISNSYGKAVSTAMSGARKIPQAIKRGLGSLVGAGADLIAGLWNGIKAKFDGVVARVRALASKLPTAVKKVLGIASPSKVMYKLGEYTGEGFALGIASMGSAVSEASANLVAVPRATAMNANMAYEYGASYTVEVPLYVNGREFAKATAGDMQTVINQNEIRQNRMRGIRSV